MLNLTPEEKAKLVRSMKERYAGLGHVRSIQAQNEDRIVARVLEELAAVFDADGNTNGERAIGKKLTQRAKEFDG